MISAAVFSCLPVLVRIYPHTYEIAESSRHGASGIDRHREEDFADGVRAGEGTAHPPRAVHRRGGSAHAHAQAPAERGARQVLQRTGRPLPRAADAGDRTKRRRPLTNAPPIACASLAFSFRLSFFFQYPFKNY